MATNKKTIISKINNNNISNVIPVKKGDNLLLLAVGGGGAGGPALYVVNPPGPDEYIIVGSGGSRGQITYNFDYQVPEDGTIQYVIGKGAKGVLNKIAEKGEDSIIFFVPKNNPTPVEILRGIGGNSGVAGFANPPIGAGGQVDLSPTGDKRIHPGGPVGDDKSQGDKGEDGRLFNINNRTFIQGGKGGRGMVLSGIFPFFGISFISSTPGQGGEGGILDVTDPITNYSGGVGGGGAGGLGAVDSNVFSRKVPNDNSEASRKAGAGGSGYGAGGGGSGNVNYPGGDGVPGVIVIKFL